MQLSSADFKRHMVYYNRVVPRCQEIAPGQKNIFFRRIFPAFAAFLLGEGTNAWYNPICESLRIQRAPQ